ncbi:MAG: hypothetical protein FJ144_25805, partial [Deltaproteobacteria bacterium]|nr:hypothetical protein [Deltaproteobacteria bacterium]
MVNLNELFKTHGISEEEILRGSTRLERWRPEDRELSHARARVRASGGRYDEATIGKPRSGRGIGRKHLRAAL